MKKTVLEFICRGMVAMGLGPIILAIVYLVLQQNFAVQTLTVNEVCLGIISLSALAFIVGGMNVIYQVEQLPLMLAILIHGTVLYVCYLGTYLLNGWLAWGFTPITAFSGIFILSYLGIWVIIYTVTKKKTAKLNEMLKRKQQHTDLSMP